MPSHTLYWMRKVGTALVRRTQAAMHRCPILLLLLFLTVAWPPAVAARSLVIEQFDVDILLHESGTIYVTETIRPRFSGAWNGIYRAIPVEYRSPYGFNYTLLLDFERVTDEDGNPLKYERSRERHYQKLRIWVPGATDATRTIVLHYRVENGLKFFEDHDELYWNVTGTEWEVPIEAATAHIVLPARATGVRALAFTGLYGSQAQQADVEVAGHEVWFRTQRRLGFREGLTAVVGWDKGLVKEPGITAKAALFLRSNWAFVIPLGAFGIMFWVWYTRGRDPRRRPIAPQYEPPLGLTPAEVGTLVDSSPDLRDITATLVDLAVRGYLVIEEQEEKKLLGLWSDKDYTFTLRKPKAEWDDLASHERKLLKTLFSNGSQNIVELSDLQNKFYKDLPDIRNRMFERLLARRYYSRRPDKVKQTYLIAGAVIGGLTLWGGGMISGIMGLAPGSFVAAGIVTALIIIGFGWFMPARTIIGARALEGVLGFEEFLTRVEADRYDRMIKTPEMFEKYLPYAMALGVEKNWVHAFEDIYREPPQWYRGPYGHTFHPRIFVSDLGRMSSRAGAVMASAPRSSGGSGFRGGGGFSGGGFGGGGGGGF